MYKERNNRQIFCFSLYLEMGLHFILTYMYMYIPLPAYSLSAIFVQEIAGILRGKM